MILLACTGCQPFHDWRPCHPGIHGCGAYFLDLAGLPRLRMSRQARDDSGRSKDDSQLKSYGTERLSVADINRFFPEKI
jgi:hypothetical protein